MATIVKHADTKGNARYTVRVRRKNEKPYSKTFDNEKAAKVWANEQEHRIDKGDAPPDREADRITTAQVIDKWLGIYMPKLALGDQKNAVRILTWWKGQIGHKTLARLTPDLIETVLDDHLRGGLTVHGKVRSDATVNRYRSFLSRVMGKCVTRWRYLKSNPVSLVEKHKETTGRTRFLSNEEVDKLWSLVRARGKPDFTLFVAFALATGARRGEIGGLEWKDFDMATEHVTYRDTKNDETRTVAMPSLLVKELKQYRAGLGAHPLPTMKVFKHHYFHDWRQVEPHFDEFVFHDLRHTAASAAANSGSTLFEIQLMLGHKTQAMVMRYAHLTDKTQRAVVNRVAAQNMR